MTSIYSLEHPLTGEIRYIGKTIKSLQIRYWGHLSSRSRTHTVAWIKSLRKQDLLPVIKLIEEVEDSKGAESEIYWIAQFKVWGFNLTNLTEGGEGTPGVQRSKEYRERLSKIHKGKVLSNQTKEKIRLANIGKKQSVETLKKKQINTKPFTKPILQIKDDVVIAEFSSAVEASKVTGFKLNSIRSVISGARNSVYGYKWRLK